MPLPSKLRRPKQIINRFFDQLESAQSSDFPDDNFDFARCYRAFTPNEALSIIIDDRQAYFGLKDVLFSGFVGWLIGGSRDITRRMMISEIGSILSERESNACRKHPSDASNAIEKIGHWLGAVDCRFYNEIYLSIGGTRAFLQDISKKKLRKDMEGELRGVMTIIEMTRIYHYAEVNMDQVIYLEPSANRAGQFLDTLRQDECKTSAGLRYRLLRSERATDLWKDMRPRVALLYAASTIDTNFEENETLLEALFTGEANLEHDGHHLPELLGRARFFIEEVLARSTDRQSANAMLKIFPYCDAKPFQPPRFEPSLADSIKLIFQRKPR